MSGVVMSAIIANEAAKSSRRNSSISTNPPNDLAADQTTIVALVDLDEEQNSISQNSLSSKNSKQRKPKHHHRSHLQAATDEPIKRSSSPDSRKKKEHSHHHHHHHHHHHQQPIINTEQEQPKLPKQLNIPTTLIVTDSNAVVIDNIDLNSISDQVFSPPPQLKSPPDQNEMGMKSTQSQTNLISSVSEVGKKRSDSKSSSIRDYSVIFPNNLDPIAGHSIDVAKLSGDYGGCCLCILLRRVFHCNCCCSKSSHQQSTPPQQQSNQPNQSTKKPNSLNSCCLLFFTQLTKYLIGFSVTLIFGVSFVAMNYLIRRTFNLRKLQRLNSTFPGPLAIETTSTKYNMDCEFCFSLIWLCTSLLTLLYPVYIMFRWVLLKIKKPKKTLRVSALFASSLNIFKNPPINNYKKIPFDSTKTDQTGAEKNRANRIYLKQNYYVKMGAITLLWLLSAYLYLRALDLLYCIDVVILFSMNYSCIYMIKWIILHHKFIPLRLLGFILSIASTIFVFYSEGFTFNLKFLGNFCVTTSAIGASILQIIWEINTRQKKNHQRIMFLTLVGFSCLVFAWPVVLILEFSFVQKIPSVLASLTSMSEPLKECIISISIACSLGFLRVFMQKFGSMFTKEIFLHMGSIIAIPLAFAIDMRINNISLSSLKTGAFICICIGYIFLVVPENLYSDVKKFFFPHESTADLSNVNISLTRKYQQNQQHQHNHSGNKPSTSPHHLQNLFAGAKSNI